MIHALTLFSLLLPQIQPEPSSGLSMSSLENGLRFRIDSVSGASHVCAVLGIRAGSDSDPVGRSGCAQVFAAALQARLEQAEDRQAEVQVRDSGLLVVRTLPVGELPQVLASFRELLAGPLELSEDEFALARAKARLIADDETEVYPGRVLHWRAQALLASGNAPALPVCGLPDEIHALSSSEFAAWQRQELRSDRSFVLLLGGGEPQENEALLRRELADLSAAGTSLSAASGRQARQESEKGTHQWILAPFVSRALAAPGTVLEDELAFAVAMSLLSKRTAFEFGKFRSGEARARFPFLDYDFVAGQGFALINRRGFDGDQSARVVQEIENFLRPIREYGFTEREVAAARKSLAAMRRIPPFSDQTLGSMRRIWRILYTKALVLAAYELNGWPEDLCQRLENVQAADVNRVLQQALEPQRSPWLILEPAGRQAPVKKGG
ncbi:MAG: peptidase M16 family protein [Planctomycetota bacterium]|jgi:predicted Zn-dependent peptidase